MELFAWGAVFAVSIVVLVKAADSFTEAAERVGVYLGIPSFIVGVTIVAIGTSLPELVSSVIAVLRDSSEIVVGNVAGSNITNIFLVLGVASILGRRLRVTYEIIHVDLPLLVGSAFMMAWVVWDQNVSVPEALALIAGAVIYVSYTVMVSSRISPAGDEPAPAAEERERPATRTWIVLAAGAAFIYLGANYTVEAVIRLADILEVGKELIAISAVALGTSLPELTVSIVAARKGNLETAMGNVLGSSIFNSFAVMGIPALVGTLVIPASVLSFGLPVMLVATLLYFFMAQDKDISRWEGWLLIVFYVLFVGHLFGLF